MSVVDLAAKRVEREPHLSGHARCLACGHRWAAVAPLGTVWMECPECSLRRGRFVNEVVSGPQQWVCQCGNDLFHITPEYAYCPNCGMHQSF